MRRYFTPEVGRASVEEDEPSRVRWPGQADVHLREEGIPEPVGGKDVPASVSHVGRRAGHRVEDALHVRPHLLLRRAAARRSRCLRSTRKVEEMRSLRLIELKRLSPASCWWSVSAAGRTETPG